MAGVGAVSFRAMPEVPEGWMTLDAAATAFGAKRDRLQKAAKTGRLRAWKVGGNTAPWLVHQDDVRQFLATSRRGMRTDLEKKRAAE